MTAKRAKEAKDYRFIEQSLRYGAQNSKDANFVLGFYLVVLLQNPYSSISEGMQSRKIMGHSKQLQSLGTT